MIEHRMLYFTTAFTIRHISEVLVKEINVWNKHRKRKKGMNYEGTKCVILR
jgi:hypothetical protein